MEEDIKDLRASVDAVVRLKDNVLEMRGAVSGMQSDIAELKGGVSRLAMEQGEIKVNVAIIKTEVANHVTDLMKDVAEIKGTTSNRSSEMWRQAFYFLAGLVASGAVALATYFLNTL